MTVCASVIPWKQVQKICITGLSGISNGNEFMCACEVRSIDTGILYNCKSWQWQLTALLIMKLVINKGCVLFVTYRSGDYVMRL
jgi:hypothetical protein